MESPVSITGMGIICAIGNDVPSVLESLRNRRSGIRAMEYLQSVHSDIPVGEVAMSDLELKELLGIRTEEPVSRNSMLGAVAIREALASAGAGDLSNKRVALVSGTTVGVMDVTEKYYERMKTDPSLQYLPHSNECGRSTLEMASFALIPQAKCCTVSTACSSALNSIMIGTEMLLRDEADIVIAGGAESLSKFHLNGFNTLMILDRERCRPFDDTRSGLNLGEGAAFVVLEKNASESRTLSYVRGYANKCDAFHQTASSENGEGAYLAMTEALEMASLSPGDIQYVNAHGTGTPNNDLSESRALQRVFGDNMPEVSSTKAFTGHTTSASGSIETVICILAMQHGFTPPSLGCERPIPGGIVPTKGRDGVVLDNVLCNAFGFGGNDSSLIISRFRYPLEDGCQGAPHKVKVVAREKVDSVEDLSSLREFISPIESRRMGKLMKAGHLSAIRALKAAGTDCPDAIVSATSRGMLEVSTAFLEEIVTNGEEHLKPTLFMQSTHNTIGSALAIRTRCHGYNITYSHGDESLAWALWDAERLVSSGKARTVLVEACDETLNGTSTESFCAEGIVLAVDDQS